MSGVSFIHEADITLMEKEAIRDDLIQIKPYTSFWLNYDHNDILYFMWKYGVYVLPTQELIDWLKHNTDWGRTIEIGAGNGAIARALKIPATDSMLQADPSLNILYKITGQPVIKYPDDIEKLDALAAVKKYKPKTVVGAFITDIKEGNVYGVDEQKMLRKIDKYINIGNMVTHAKKPLLKIDHVEYYFSWLVTRAADQKKNRIFVWD